MIDLKLIEDRIKEIQRRRNFLEDYAEMTFEEFSSDLSIYELAIRHLQVALEACIDIGKHIAAVNNFNMPEQTSKVFSVLARNKIISKDLADKLNSAGGARNVIVHGYLSIDLTKIFKIIQKDLSDFEQFVVEIGNYLEREKAVS